MALYNKKYDPSFCEKVADWSRVGVSKKEMAFYLQVHRDRLYEWAKVYPEFNDALKGVYLKPIEVRKEPVVVSDVVEVKEEPKMVKIYIY